MHERLCVCVCSQLLKWTASFRYDYAVWPLRGPDTTYRIRLIIRQLCAARAFILKGWTNKKRLAFSFRLEFVIKNLHFFKSFSRFGFFWTVDPSVVFLSFPPRLVFFVSTYGRSGRRPPARPPPTAFPRLPSEQANILSGHKRGPTLPLADVQTPSRVFWENKRRNGTTGFNETITRH